MSDFDFSQYAQDWDWLPRAAIEIERFLERMLQEEPIRAHAISGRNKSIESFIRKAKTKQYDDVRAEMNDCVAARIILYTERDKDRVCELLRDRFICRDAHNPGRDRSVGMQGYDTEHFVVIGECSHEQCESPNCPHGQTNSGWLVGGGALSRYLSEYGGLEIQVRTVASHAWSEFEHSRRYKGAEYALMDDATKKNIDALFRDADTNRRDLDRVFLEIEKALREAAASTPVGEEPDEVEQAIARDTEEADAEAPHTPDRRSPLTPDSLAAYLSTRFPDAAEPTRAGLRFGLELLRGVGVNTVDGLIETLRPVNTEILARILAREKATTSIRCLDDELLAALGHDYIGATESIGEKPWVTSRPKQLEWRYELIKNKRNAYTLSGNCCPGRLKGKLLPAARALREIVTIIGESAGREHALVTDVVCETADALDQSARATEIELTDGTLFVRTNISRRWALDSIELLLEANKDVNLYLSGPGVPRGIAPPA